MWQRDSQWINARVNHRRRAISTEAAQHRDKISVHRLFTEDRREVGTRAHREDSRQGVAGLRVIHQPDLVNHQTWATDYHYCQGLALTAELLVTWQGTVHKHGARVDMYALAAYYQIEVEVDVCREVEWLGAQR